MALKSFWDAEQVLESLLTIYLIRKIIPTAGKKINCCFFQCCKEDKTDVFTTPWAGKKYHCLEQLIYCRSHTVQEDGTYHPRNLHLPKQFFETIFFKCHNCKGWNSRVTRYGAASSGGIKHENKGTIPNSSTQVWDRSVPSIIVLKAQDLPCPASFSQKTFRLWR